MSEPRYALAPAGKAQVYCKQCGALVVLQDAHEAFHRQIDDATAGDAK